MKQIRVPIIFHPPTWEDYSAEEVASEIMMNAFGACKIDYPEMTNSIEEVMPWLEMFELNIAKFNRSVRMTWEPDQFPSRPISTGTLILKIL